MGTDTTRLWSKRELEDAVGTIVAAWQDGTTALTDAFAVAGENRDDQRIIIRVLEDVARELHEHSLDDRIDSWWVCRCGEQQRRVERDDFEDGDER